MLKSLKPWEQLRKWKKFELNDFSKSVSYNNLLQTITWKEKTSIQSEFSRNKKKLSSPEDVANYIDDYYKKDIRKNPQKYF